MKNLLSLTLLLTLVYALPTHATINGNNKSSRNMNFYGTLETHAGKVYTVDHITINKNIAKIHAYEKPETEQTNKNEIILAFNPTSESAVSILELQEIASITVPNPEINWVFQKESRKRNHKFLEIDVTSNSGTTRSYLLEKRTIIYCNELDQAGPIEKEVPLTAVKKLTIDGYEVVDTKKEKK